MVNAVAIEGQPDELMENLTVAEDWLYEEEGETAEISVYEMKLAALKKPVNVWKRRIRENARRPKAVESFTAVLAAVLAHVDTWNATHPQITEDEVQDVRDKVAEMEAWLLDQQDAQAEVAQNADPVLTLTMIARKQSSLKSLVARLITKPKPAPVEVEEEEEEEEGDDTTTTTTTENDAADATEDAASSVCTLQGSELGPRAHSRRLG